MMKRSMRLAVMLLAAVLSLCSCTKPLRTDAPMCGFTFSHSGMHTGLIYTLSAQRDEGGWRAELSLLCGEREYSFAMTDEEAAKLAALVQEHRLNAWNGFDKVDMSALDGTGFELTIDYEDGQRLCASGSNAFPEGYREAREAILEFFAELMERNGIENPL